MTDSVNPYIEFGDNNSKKPRRKLITAANMDMTYKGFMIKLDQSGLALKFSVNGLLFDSHNDAVAYIDKELKGGKQV